MNTPPAAERRPGGAGDAPDVRAPQAPRAAKTEPAKPTQSDPTSAAQTETAELAQGDPAEAAQIPRRQRPARPMFGTTVLWGEVFVVFFALLVAYGLRLAGPTTLGILGAVGMVTCAVAARVQRTSAGIAVGSAAQVLLLLGGFVVPMMFVVGAVFSVIWVLGVWLGLKIDRERADRETSATTPHSATEGNG